MSNTITLTLDQFTQAQSLNTVVSNLERMLSILQQVDKYKDLLNKATGNPQDLLRLSAELARLEKQLIALQREEEKLRAERSRADAAASNATAAASRASEQQRRSAESAARAEEKKRRELAAQQGLIGQIQDRIRRLNQLQRQATTPEQIERVNRMLEQQRNRLRELNQLGRQTTNTFGNALNSFQFKFNFLGNLMAEGLMNSIGAIKQFGTEAIQLSLKAEGIRTAFGRLNDPNLLAELRKATSGTVSDLTLMTNAVKASNFKLPIQELGTYFKFAQQRALETGESIDYLVESIVLGISRKSILIIDNLGISAKEVQGEFQKTGDFAKAVSNIIEREMKRAGEGIENNATKVARLTTQWENFKLKLGDYLVEGGVAISQFFDLVSGKISYAELELKNFGDAFAKIGGEQANAYISVIESTTKKTEEKTAAVKALNAQIQTQIDNLGTEYKAGRLSADQYIYRRRQLRALIITLENYNRKINEPPKKEPEKDKDYTEIENRIRLIQDARERELAEAELQKQKELDVAAEKGYNTNKILEFYRRKALEINKKYDDKEIDELIKQGEAEQDQYISNKEKLRKEKEKQEAEDKEQRDIWFEMRKEEDELIAEWDKQNAENERKRMEERMEMADQVISQAIDGINRRRDAQIQAIDDEITRQQEAVSQQRELANQGAANSLAAEERRLAELERKKQEAQRRQERLQKIETYYNLLSSYAKDDPKTAPFKALAQLAIAEGIAAAFFEKGGIAGEAKEFTTIGGGQLSRSHKSGNVLAVLSPNEGILNEKQMQNLGGADGFYSLQKILDNPNIDLFNQQAQPLANIVASGGSVDMSPVVAKLDAVERAIKRIPGNSFAVDSVGNLIHTRIEQGKTTITNKGRFIAPQRNKRL